VPRTVHKKLKQFPVERTNQPWPGNKWA